MLSKKLGNIKLGVKEEKKKNINMKFVLSCVVLIATIGILVSFFNNKKIDESNSGAVTEAEEKKYDVEFTIEDEAEKAYEEFLNIQRFAHLKLDVYPNKSECYITDFLFEGKNVKLKYCYIYPEAGAKKQLALMAEYYTDYNDVYYGICYILKYENDQLMVSDYFYTKDMNWQTEMNNYGVINNYMGSISEGINHGTYYIDADGVFRKINDYIYVSVCDGMYDYSCLRDEKSKKIIKDVIDNCNAMFDYNLYDYLEIDLAEYYLDEAYYVPFFDEESDLERLFIEKCKEQGMKFVTETQIAKIVEEKKSLIGDKRMFDKNYPDWQAWN